jgi:hypothetical protein
MRAAKVRARNARRVIEPLPREIAFGWDENAAKNARVKIRQPFPIARDEIQVNALDFRNHFFASPYIV